VKTKTHDKNIEEGFFGTEKGTRVRREREVERKNGSGHVQHIVYSCINMSQ
jgi:hypothetical protein